MKNHVQLILDLSRLIKNASAFKYHDYKSTEDTPKMLLMNDLFDMQTKLKQGQYDNYPDGEDAKSMKKALLEDGQLNEDQIKELFGF